MDEGKLRAWHLTEPIRRSRYISTTIASNAKGITKSFVSCSGELTCCTSAIPYLLKPLHNPSGARRTDCSGWTLNDQDEDKDEDVA